MKTMLAAALVAATALTATSALAAPDFAVLKCQHLHPERHCSDLEPACFRNQRQVYDQCLAKWRDAVRPRPHVDLSRHVTPLVPVWER